MLEEFAMEKKSTNRSSQPPAKGASTESKKLQDGVGSKQFPRSYRKREPNGVSGQKYEPSRKPVPQKNKSFDKRPRQRTQCFDGGKENPKVAVEDVAEYGSVLVPGSKKQNLNHLLNFHYAPREGVVPGSGHWRHGVPGYCRQAQGRWFATYKHKYNKEQFLQANCQFVVKADGNYTSYSSNPDALVDWDLIEQIRLQSCEMLSCPICLYPPVAAKMTRCGHVYCWPCILHYLALSDKTWRKCPICYEAVHKEDLKSVLAIPHTQFSVGTEITLRLMKREKGSLIATPAAEFGTHPSGRLLSVSETAADAVYSKLLLATSAEVVPIIDRERKELEIQLSEEKDSPELCFIEQALELLKQREDVTLRNNQSHQHLMKNISALPMPEDSGTHQSTSISVQKTPVVVYTSAFDDCVLEGASGEEESPTDEGAGVVNHCRYESISSESFCSDDGTIAAASDSWQPANTSLEEIQPVKYFYFYQAADGQHIYLHSLNVRMLEHCYGSLKDCPPMLRGRIMEKESGSMTEELRGRLRYIQHLPVTCQFDVVELMLRPPLVSRATLDQFQDQLEMRKRKRQRRAREERRREKHIVEEENRRWGRCPAPEIRLESHRQFPLCGSETPPAPATPPGPPSVASSEETTACSFDSDMLPDITQSLQNATVEPAQLEEVSSSVGSPESSGFSFAQMLREGRGKVSASWTIPHRVDKQAAPQHSDSDPEQEGHGPSPSYKLNFSDAIALALEKATPSREDEQEESAASTGKKKKKQKKPKVLFATGMACPGQ